LKHIFGIKAYLRVFHQLDFFFFLYITAMLSLARISRTAARTGLRALSATPMFCQQCEQAKGGTGCTTVGNCGKEPEVSALQDLLIHSIKGLAEFAHVGRKAGIVDAETDAFVMESIFSTLTNVQFSETRMEEFIKESVDRRDNMKAALEKAGEPVPAPNAFNAWMPEEDLIAQGDAVGIQPRMEKDDADVVSLQEMVTYGIKGVAAYAAHCLPYGGIPDEAPKYIYEAFSYLTKPVEEQTVGDLVGLSLMCGATNLATMGALYDGHSKHFGAPTPTPVRMTPKEGKAIVVSGHDLHMLEDILLKTEGKGINVYTHGEMLPAHGYPGLSKFDHLVGHYGGAWQNQQKQFAKFPGAILMTTNCIMPPTDTYADRIFTTSVVGVDGTCGWRGVDETFHMPSLTVPQAPPTQARTTTSTLSSARP
jgi:hydroxylamine reductase